MNDIIYMRIRASTSLSRPPFIVQQTYVQILPAASGLYRSVTTVALEEQLVCRSWGFRLPSPNFDEPSSSTSLALFVRLNSLWYSSGTAIAASLLVLNARNLLSLGSITFLSPCKSSTNPGLAVRKRLPACILDLPPKVPLCFLVSVS